MARVISGVSPAQVLAAVEAVMSRRWDWSRDWHCLGDASDVFQMLWGADPMAGLRGQARTFGGARRIVQGAGGMDALAAREFKAAGLQRGPECTGQIVIGPTTARAFGGRATLICIMPGQWAGKGLAGFDIIDWHGEGWAWPQ